MLSLLCKNAKWWFMNSHYDVHYISIGLVPKMKIDANDFALNKIVNGIVDRWMPSNTKCTAEIPVLILIDI